jgi:spore coat protein U-like protein
VQRISRALIVVRAFVVAALLLVCAADADAAQCSISTTPVSFGTYNVFATSPTDSTGTITYNCNGGARFILITISRGGSPTFAPRRMLKGAEQLPYNLYRNASRTIVWGDGTGGSSLHLDVDPPNHQHISVPVFGRIPAGQDVEAGAYTDTVTVTINY